MFYNHTEQNRESRNRTKKYDQLECWQKFKNKIIGDDSAGDDLSILTMTVKPTKQY